MTIDHDVIAFRLIFYSKFDDLPDVVLRIEKCKRCCGIVVFGSSLKQVDEQIACRGLCKACIAFDTFEIGGLDESIRSPRQAYSARRLWRSSGVRQNAIIFVTGPE